MGIFGTNIEIIEKRKDSRQVFDEIPMIKHIKQEGSVRDYYNAFITYHDAFICSTRNLGLNEGYLVGIFMSGLQPEIERKKIDEERDKVELFGSCSRGIVEMDEVDGEKFVEKGFKHKKIEETQVDIDRDCEGDGKDRELKLDDKMLEQPQKLNFSKNSGGARDMLKNIINLLNCNLFYHVLLVPAEDQVVIFDLQQRLVLGSLQTPFVKYIVCSNDMETVALLSKHAIVIASKKLDHRCTLHETIRVKGGAWDNNGVFIFTTLNHIKYCLPKGDNGIIKTLDVPVYITKVLGNRIFCLDRDGKSMVIVIDATAYIFKLSLLKKKYDHVMSMIRNSQFCGQAMIAYLREKGFPEVALHFVKDERTRFDLALNSGDKADWGEEMDLDNVNGFENQDTQEIQEEYEAESSLRVLGRRGFKQKSGINYFDTYAPVARISTIRLLIAMASIHNLIIHQMDMKITFLNGELEEEQTPKQYHQKFDEVVLSNGYLLNQADKCVYSKFDESGKEVIICLYVDDMLIFGTDQVQVDLTKEFLSSRFSMKDMWEAYVILGIRIKHESNRIAISQSYYIENVLKKFNYFNCTPVSTPMDTSEKLMPNNGQVVSQLEYSRVIGCLMYAMTCTRPDIAFAVGKLSRYTSNPGTQHWQAIQRVLKYLKKTMDYKLMYSGYPLVLEGYTDASWINNTEDNSSTSGWVFLLGGGVISWASKKQTCITGLTMEYDFVALESAGKEAEWLKNLLREIPLWSKPITPISIYYDSATTLAKDYSQMYNGKSRHLGVRHSMIRELITNGMVSIEFVRSQQNLADHLTKGLARDLVIKSAEGICLKSN
ncbi:zinc finger, CCHC-type containing protein [Tanacetum coccineum]